METATWPPLEVHDVDGWRLGWSHGFTRRGNSAVPPTSVDQLQADGLDAILTRVEAFYADRGGPSIVRVSPDRSPTLDEHLARRGYAPLAPTCVMVAALTPGPGHALRAGAYLDRDDAQGTARVVRASDGWAMTVAHEPDEDWLTAWLGVKATSTSDRSSARRLLCGADARYLAVRDVDGVLGVVRAAPAGPWVGLSCLAVAPRARRRGVARSLTLIALEQARERWAFLQVEESNHAARSLYAGLGFQVADTYVYRQR